MAEQKCGCGHDHNHEHKEEVIDIFSPEFFDYAGKKSKLYVKIEILNPNG